VSTAGWRLPINAKLLAILAVPVLGYLVLATTAVLQAQRTADRIRNQASVVRTAVGPTSLTTSLIDERTITRLEDADLQDDLTLRIGNSTEARRATDEQLSALRALVAENREAREAYGPVVDDLAGDIEALRSDVDAGQEDPAALFSRYDELIEPLMDANATAVDRIEDAELWQGAMLSELATRQKQARAVLIDALIPVSLNQGGLTDPEETAEIGRALGAYETRDAAIRELATGPYARAGSVLIEALDAADLAALARNTLDTGTLDSSELFDVASYKGGFVYDAPSGDYIHDYFRASIVEILDQDSSERTEAAASGVRTNLLAGSIGLVVTAGITWLVSRSITRPLRSLTQQAIDTATYGLPESVQEIQETPLGEDVDWPAMEPIDVSTNDEVADVAHAFNTVQQSALDLAVEEALLRRLVTDSLVTLGQRNQDLLDRQLAFITDLEQDETDPDTLADLFHLDHLAIRMRRNAESLLVLAGIDPPRTWLGPTPVGDVVRAALGEAEEYKRVRVQDIDPATIAGSATAELSHLLAELIENALRFSPSYETVEVHGRRRSPGEGSGAGYSVTVEDAGTGMSRSEIELANERLTGIEAPTRAPSKYMGHYIAGKLAARHGIVVRLRSNLPARGITATVDIPAHLLTTEAPPDTQSQLPPLPPSELQDRWDVPTEEMPAADVRLLDLSAPVRVPGVSPPSRESDKSTRKSTGKPAGKSTPKKSRKRKIRPLPTSKLPVPPPPTEPLAIEQSEAPPDPDQEGQAS
jgi:HAMP domain-containing protein